MNFSRVTLTLLFFVCAFGYATARTQTVPVPAAPTRFATDRAGFLDSQTVSALDERLHAYETKTGHQVLLYVTPTTGDEPIEDWTQKAFSTWKVGRKGIDDGLVLFVFSADRKVRIHVGYGLEDRVTDVTAARIIRDTIAPQLKASHPDAAVTDGIDAMLQAIDGSSVAGEKPLATAVASSVVDCPHDAFFGWVFLIGVGGAALVFGTAILGSFVSSVMHIGGKKRAR